MHRKIKLLFVGLNTIDIQFFVDAFPKPNTKTKAQNNEVAIGGPATNAAITAAFLGASVTLVSPVGIHSLSNYIKHQLNSLNVSLIDPVSTVNSDPVFASIITDNTNGDRTILSYMPQNNYNNLLYNLNIDYSSFDLALFDGFYLPISNYIANELKKHNVPCILDGGSWKPGLENFIENIDIAICSNDFLPPNCKSKTDLANYLNYCGVNKTIITRGNNPVLVFTNNNNYELPVAKIRVKDTLGAGDIYHGAFCYYYALHKNLNTALLCAANVAGFSCGYNGTRQWMQHFAHNTVRV